LPELIDDYLAWNPTRDRELDMLPLFAHLDPDRVARGASRHKVKARPAFHYRLPDSRIDEPGWGVVLDWNRWVQVERLAADRARLDAMAGAWLARGADRDPAAWAAQTSAWLSA
jgi:hypothetical protein